MLQLEGQKGGSDPYPGTETLSVTLTPSLSLGGAVGMKEGQVQSSLEWSDINLI